jgi:hypothetical protein
MNTDSRSWSGEVHAKQRSPIPKDSVVYQAALSAILSALGDGDVGILPIPQIRTSIRGQSRRGIPAPGQSTANAPFSSRGLQQRQTGLPAALSPKTDIPIPYPLQNATLSTSRLTNQPSGTGMLESYPFFRSGPQFEDRGVRGYPRIERHRPKPQFYPGGHYTGVRVTPPPPLPETNIPIAYPLQNARCRPLV